MQAALTRIQKRLSASCRRTQKRQTNVVVFMQLLVLVVADHGRHLQL